MSTVNNTNTKPNTRSNSTSSLNTLTVEDKLNKRPIDIQSGLDDLWNKIQQAISQSNSQIEAKIESCMTKIDGLEYQLATIKEECTSNIDRLSLAVKEVRSDLCTTNELVGRMERSSELIISGIPYTTNEDLKNVFLNIAQCLDYTTAPMVDLKRMARPPIKPGDSPSIICQFALRNERDTFYRRYMEHRNLNLTHVGFQNNNRIYVNENLTQHARDIRSEALKLKRQGLLERVYTKQGVVFVKAPTAATAEPCHSLAHLAKTKNPTP